MGNNQFRVPWIDGNVNRLCEKREKLYNSWKISSDDPKLKLEYNKTRNKVHKILEHKRNTYYINQINSNFKNTKKVYQLVNQMIGRVTLSIDAAILKAFDAQGLTTKAIANNFSVGFDQAVKDIIPQCSIKLTDPSTYRRPTDSSILFQKASAENILKIITKLNSNKAPGMDNIRVSDIKMVGKDVSSAIADLINCSIKSGVYPDELKVGCVRPIHKKGKRNCYSNYRPITLLSSVDKIVEKYVCEQIHNYYRKHDVLYKNQFGFQSGKGTTDLLSMFTDEVNEHLNNRMHVLVLFIDFSRAFDTLEHKQLVDRLDNCGVRGPLLRWCEDYLKNRTSTVKIDNTYSEPITATEGTAQGSVLGPLHFLTYVNEMSNCINHCTCYQFADDTCLVAADTDPQIACDLLQADLNSLIRWCHDAGLVLNADKTKLLVIKSPYIKNAFPKSCCTCPWLFACQCHNHVMLLPLYRSSKQSDVPRLIDRQYI